MRALGDVDLSLTIRQALDPDASHRKFVAYRTCPASVTVSSTLSIKLVLERFRQSLSQFYPTQVEFFIFFIFFYQCPMS